MPAETSFAASSEGAIAHPQQQGRILKDGNYELRIPYSGPRELAMDMLKHGAEVEVISPKPLREAVMQHLRTALARYR